MCLQRTTLSSECTGIIGVIFVLIWQLNTHIALIWLVLSRRNPASIFTEEISSIMLVFLLQLIGSEKHYWAAIAPLKQTI